MKLITVFHILEFCTSTVQQCDSQTFHNLPYHTVLVFIKNNLQNSAIYRGHLQGVASLSTSTEYLADCQR